MTPNRTSQAVEELLETLQPLEIRMAFPAIAEKYKRMEKALQDIGKWAGDPELDTQDAKWMTREANRSLSFDPFA